MRRAHGSTIIDPTARSPGSEADRRLGGHARPRQQPAGRVRRRRRASPTLNWYVNPDGVGHVDRSYAEQCSTDAYDIEIQLLPTGATDQRTQLARRLAAKDSSTDLMSLDPVFVAEFANAGWLAELPERGRQRGSSSDDVPRGRRRDRHLGRRASSPFPQWANTQVLWYRKSLAEAAGLDMTQPVTWDQIIDAAADERRHGRRPGQQVRGLRRPGSTRSSRAPAATSSPTPRPGEDAEGRPRLRGRSRRRGRSHPEARRLRRPPQADLTVSNEGTSLGQMFERRPGRVHDQLDLRLPELQGLVDAGTLRRAVRRPRLGPLPADRRGRGVQAPDRWHRHRRRRLLRQPGRGPRGGRSASPPPRTRSTWPSTTA